MHRRSVLRLLACSPWLAMRLLGNANAEQTKPEFRLSTFEADVTPPLGSALCGGWIQSATAVDNPLRALGIVLFGGERPIVLCAIDWVEINNSTYDIWREALAAAAETDVSCVALQCVHPHNTPWANTDADDAIRAIDARRPIVDSAFVRLAIRRTAEAVKASLGKSRAVTHMGVGQGRVKEVASNRRILGADGKVAAMRMSKCSDEKARAAPEGLIDPFLKTVSFWADDEPVAALHYYATHPMSYYGDGHVTSDFCGLARDRRQEELPQTFQIYFTGCAGDVAAGKYNDGSHAMRQTLCNRVHAGMVAAWDTTVRTPIKAIGWQTSQIDFPSRREERFAPAQLRSVMHNADAPFSKRAVAAINLTWLDRSNKAVEISCLRIGNVAIVNLPGEPFIAYQLFAQAQKPDDFVCVAGYGDGGMGYIPLAQSYEQGGYEPTMSFIAPESEQLLKDAIQAVLVVKS